MLTRAPEALGIDDFAFQCGHGYGTILIDMKTHTPVRTALVETVCVSCPTFVLGWDLDLSFQDIMRRRPTSWTACISPLE